MRAASGQLDSMFNNIVYRLDYAEDKILQVRKKIFWASAILLGVTFLLSVGSRFISAKDIFWIDTAKHSLVESYCAIISIFISYIIYREYKTSGRRSNLYLLLGFFSMGIYDLFHAYANHSITLFVWFHSLSAFSGAAFFLWSAVSVRNASKDPPWLRYLLVTFGVAVTIATAITVSRYSPPLPYAAVTIKTQHHIPVDVPLMGEFTASTVVVNFISAVCFLLSSIYFTRHFTKTNDMLYHTFALSSFLFLESEMLFVFSRLWDPSWWYWHAIKLFIFVGLIVGLVHGLMRTFNDLHESRRRLTKTVKELQHAYEDLKETQEELLESEKLASIGRMAATIAHEIRNPLGAISNSIGIFKRHTQLAGDDRELMSIVEEEIRRLNRTITDFLNFAKPSPPEKTLVDLNGLIDETLALLEAGNGQSRVRVCTYFDRELPDVLMDRDAIRQCFWNIFINSMQAMPNGGTLSVWTRYAISMDGNGPYKEANIVISDSGSGMSHETLSKAFQPFFSTKTKGTGLGLSIVQRIIKQHGGTITMVSEPGVRTQVEINLPVRYNEPSANREGTHDFCTGSR